MDRKLRNILIAVGIVIVILVIVPFLIPVNQFKPTIEAKASAALGRQVQMGNLSLSLFTGSLSAENLVVGDDPKFSQTPFLTAKGVRVGVAMMPLIFSRALNITSVTIKDPAGHIATQSRRPMELFVHRRRGGKHRKQSGSHSKIPILRTWQYISCRWRTARSLLVMSAIPSAPPTTT